ncbi:PAS/PAC sensor hybrid histidine kinase [Chloroherpeton thalassium ATCC 35110]|uniref:histidine kinase n=1 Tax=Chloroherpeton thalassium (strain ATCC 35110 / GB-78) TaxID=517418 RepID=B3QUW3_CHLT3|nr:PAS domain S-box protein [Chloroherpeton thalassium]ACF14464.1 PAS/PAC sensor hybrid histidine kinase [Chloroherpeton thalassium ATCC 35110]
MPKDILMPKKPTYEELENRLQELERALSTHKETQNSLQKLMANYHTIFDVANDAIFIHALEDGQILDVNQKMLEMYGYTKEEALQLSVESFSKGLPPYTHAEAQKYIQKAAMGEPQIFEWESKKKNGEVFWTDVSLKKVILDGKARIIAIVRDIHKRKKAVEALRFSEEKYRRLAENSPDMIYHMSLPDGTYEYVSPAAEEIFGYPPQTFYENPFFIQQVIHPDSQDFFETQLQELLQCHLPPSYEYRIIHKDQHVRWLNQRSVGVRNENGQLIAIEGIVTDVTGRKEAEAAFHKEERKYKAIIQTAIDGFWLTDLQGKILEINEAYAKMSGYNQEELRGMNICDLDAINSPLEIATRIETLFRQGHDRFETQHRRKDGSVYDVEVSGQYLANENGKLVIFLRDISPYKRAEKEKEALQAQLLQAQKMESIGRLAGGVAHDFNNMLSVIQGYAEMALEKMHPTPKLYNALLEIRKAAQRSADVTRQLLAFARKQTIAPKVLDLNQTVGNMLKMIQRLIGEDIHLTWLPGVNLWPLKIDPSQIDQILVNLCVNARDAIHGVGKLTIETETASINEEYCKHHLGFFPGNFVVLSVSDDGCGMDKETLRKLFEPFFTTKGMDKGTGLGLATVYGIVKQNKGFINVYSEPNIGTTFKIYFPCYQSVEEVQTQTSTAETRPHGNETVLLVEDELAILNVTKMMLESLGYHALTATSPQQAINLARTHAGQIDILLTDVVMPEMNGRELLRTLLSIYPNLKHLYMSGYTANVIAHHGVLEEGVNFIQKPFSKEELSVKIREALK